MSDKKKDKNKCRKVPIEITVCDANHEDFDADELKTTDVAVNSKKVMQTLNNYLNKIKNGVIIDEED